MTSVKGFEAPAKLMIELSQSPGPGLFVFLQKSEGFSNHLTRGVVAAGFHFGADVLLKLRCKGNIHGILPGQSVALITKIVNL
jgi:hypothetical protein